MEMAAIVSIVDSFLFSLPGWRSIPCSGTGYFALGGKVTKTPPGFPRTPICPIGRHQGRFPVATEILPGRWPLVIGAVVYPLRLTALGLRGVSFWEAGTKAGPKDVCSSSVKIRKIYPFKRATAEAGRAARRRSDARRDR